MLPLMPLSFELSIFFMQVCRIQEYDLSDLRGGISAINLAPKTLAD
jgi:hypothetical protein